MPMRIVKPVTGASKRQTSQRRPAGAASRVLHYLQRGVQTGRPVMPMPRNKTEDDITDEVLRRFGQTPDPRLREIMLSLIGHLHAFVKEVDLTETEWFQAIEILTKAGHLSGDKRQEFILFSDTLG